MTKDLLPPEFVTIPVEMVYSKAIKTALRDAWIQLRGLAWGQQETPELSFSTIKELTGRDQRSLYIHLRKAKAMGLLAWRPGHLPNTIIVSFPSNDELCKIIQKLINTPIIDSNIYSEEETCALQKTAKRGRKPKADTCPQEWMTALYELCGKGNGATLSPGFRKRTSETGKALIAGGAQLEQLARFKDWWYRSDWRGKRGSPPTPEFIRDNWHLAMNGNGASGAPSGGASRAREALYRVLAEEAK